MKKTRTVLAGAVLACLSLAQVAHAADKLPGKVAYAVQKQDKAISSVEQALKQGDAKRARRVLDQLKEDLANTREYNKAKVPADHPAYQRIETAIGKLEAALADHEKRAGAVAEALGPAVEALNEQREAVDLAMREARSAINKLTSVEMAFETNQDQGPLHVAITELGDKVAAMNGRVPAATAVIDAFFTEFGNERKLRETMPNKSRDIWASVEALQRQLTTWERLRDKTADKLVRAAEQSIGDAPNLLKRKGAARMVAITEVQAWAIGFHGTMLRAVEALLPQAGKDADPDSVVELSSRQQQNADKVVKLRGDIEKLKKQIVRIKRAAAKAAKARLAKQRFPKGKKLGAQKAAVMAALKASIGKPLRVVVSSPWDVRKEARFKNGRWHVNTFKYMTVWMAKKTKSKKYMVYRVTVRQRKNGASWGPVKYWSVGESFEVLKKNLHK